MTRCTGHLPAGHRFARILAFLIVVEGVSAGHGAAGPEVFFGGPGTLQGIYTQSHVVGATRTDGVLRFDALGAVPNDGKDDSDALVRACGAACQAGQPLWLPAGTYEIDRNTVITCTGDLHLIGLEEVHFNLDALLTFTADRADAGIVLQADAPRRSRRIVVDDTRQCATGDLLCIDTNVVAESAWKTPKREVHRIEDIPDASTLVLGEPLVFGYRTGDDGLSLRVYHERRISMANIIFDVNDRQLATLYFSGGTMLYNCRWVERDAGQQDGYHYSPGWSVGVVGSHLRFEGGFYGCVPACSRNVVFEHVAGDGCAGHVIAPNNWCYGVYVNHLSGSECGSLVDSHPSFEVHYNDVSGYITGIPNLRSLGGSIRNYHVESTQRGPATLYLQNLDLQVDREIYDETTLLLEDFTLLTPNLDPNDRKNRAVVLFGYEAVLKNVNWRWFDFYPGPAWGGPTNGFHNIRIVGCSLTNLSLWRGQETIIRDSCFTSEMDVRSPQDVAVQAAADAACSVANTTFQKYTHALSGSWTQEADLRDCRFVDCETVFQPSNGAPRVRFDSCAFQHVGTWGNVDIRNVQVSNCTYTNSDSLVEALRLR